MRDRHASPPARSETVTRLRLWRQERGYSLQELADVSGFSKAMLTRAERGLRHFSPDSKIRLARSLGVPVATLFESETVDVEVLT